MDALSIAFFSSENCFAILSQNQFLRFLTHKSDNIKNAGLSLIEKNPDNSYLTPVIQSLAKASTFSQAEKSLLSFPEKTSLVQLDFRLNDPDSSTELRTGILKVFHHYHRTDAINIVISIMDEPELLILDEASNALVKLSKKTTRKKKSQKKKFSRKLSQKNPTLLAKKNPKCVS